MRGRYTHDGIKVNTVYAMTLPQTTPLMPSRQGDAQKDVRGGHDDRRDDEEAHHLCPVEKHRQGRSDGGKRGPHADREDEPEAGVDGPVDPDGDQRNADHDQHRGGKPGH